MATALITARTVPPVTLGEAKAHLKVLHGNEDVSIQTYLDAATDEVALRTGRALTTETREMTLSRFPRPGCSIELPSPPFAALTSITYIDADGTTTTLALEAVLAQSTETGAIVRPVYGTSWPSARSGDRAVAVRWICGTATSAGIPPSLRAAILLRTAERYMKREPGAAEQRTFDDLVRLHATSGWI